MATNLQQLQKLNGQEPQLTEDALDFQPNKKPSNNQGQQDYEEADYYYDDHYDEDDSSLSADETQPKIQIKNIDPQSIENPHQTKVYHQNQYTKLDQKMCFNKVQACENQEMVKEKKNKDKAQRATVEQVLDPRTLLILKKMINNGTLTQINGCLSTGKQANVYYGVQETSQSKKQYAIKIYKTSILVFKDRERYVQGQFRFRRGYCSSNPRKMVKMWAQKQLRNLNRIQGHMPCPSPLLVKSNVLVMDFIGKDGIPAPKLKDIEKDTEQFSHIYLQLLIEMRLLYQQCKLIHADLSEYNLLYYNDAIHVIDVSQSVEHDHPQAINFLRRDICNVNDFFRRKGVKIFTPQEVFVFIVSLDVAKGKQRQFLQELIDNYDDDAEIQDRRNEVFNKIKIHQNLGSIPLEKVEKQLFDQAYNGEDAQKYEHVMTGITKKNKKSVEGSEDKIEEKVNEEGKQDSSSSQSQSEESSEGEQNENKKERKEGGKQKYEGLNKQQRKHKVKEQKREKRKQKMSKKTKNKLMKKK